MIIPPDIIEAFKVGCNCRIDGWIVDTDYSGLVTQFLLRDKPLTYILRIRMDEWYIDAGIPKDSERYYNAVFQGLGWPVEAKNRQLLTPWGVWEGETGWVAVADLMNPFNYVTAASR